MEAKWYVINTYSGHEKKTRANLEHRIKMLGQSQYFEDIVVPTEHVVETKGGEKVHVERRIFPGYILVKMVLTDESWSLVRNTPGVTGFVGSENKPTPLTPAEVDRILHTSTVEKPRAKAEFAVGDQVRVVSGPLTDFTGEVAEVNVEQGKLKVMVSIFGRDTPTELGFDQVKKI
ncbi:MAG: transcription termination/antitermination protein NusG [Thermoleophilia bacterium]|nr:transcription termination/antitermination protein NusG [Thermoleophilia bacterium]